MDDTKKLREITLLFFREAMGSLANMHRDVEEYPHDEEARARWLEEIEEFARRAEGLHARWSREQPGPSKRRRIELGRTQKLWDTPQPH